MIDILFKKTKAVHGSTESSTHGKNMWNVSEVYLNTW